MLKDGSSNHSHNEQVIYSYCRETHNNPLDILNLSAIIKMPCCLYFGSYDFNICGCRIEALLHISKQDFFVSMSYIFDVGWKVCAGHGRDFFPS